MAAHLSGLARSESVIAAYALVGMFVNSLLHLYRFHKVGWTQVTGLWGQAQSIPLSWALACWIVILLVFVTHRDWRATLCCCAPLTVATALGYWFMKEFGIGLKVATMPVMVLAVGLGVDYAFYIYSRLQRHIQTGTSVTHAYRLTLSETGIAVIFTAITMAVGVATWSFSDLKFQADMGILLTFMFAMNMVMAVTLLPALAVVLDLLLPRRRSAQKERRGFTSRSCCHSRHTQWRRFSRAR